MTDNGMNEAWSRMKQEATAAGHELNDRDKASFEMGWAACGVMMAEKVAEAMVALLQQLKAE